MFSTCWSRDRNSADLLSFNPHSASLGPVFVFIVKREAGPGQASIRLIGLVAEMDSMKVCLRAGQGHSGLKPD